MKNNLKKIMASVVAVASLTMSIAGTNASAYDVNYRGSTEVTMSKISTRAGYSFVLSDNNKYFVICVTGPATVYYTGFVNMGSVTIIVCDSSGGFVESHYFSAGYAPTFSVYVPEGETYCFYIQSSVASPSRPISGTVYIY